MPGFFAKTGKSEKGFLRELDVLHKDFYINERIESDNFYVERLTLNKFLKDKVFVDNGLYLIVTEGIILNSLALLTKYKCKCMEDCIISMYEQNGQTFFKEFRGSFCGILVDKKVKNHPIIIVFTDHIGSRQIFYTEERGEFFFATDIFFLSEFFLRNNIKCKLNKDAAYYLLVIGFMIEDSTLFDGIHRLLPGHYLCIEDEFLTKKRYFKLNFTQRNTIQYNDLIEELDALFMKALKMDFDKDLEYGYKNHLTQLSGGLDSRMVNICAREMGVEDMLAVTMSNPGYLDEKIAQKIAKDYKFIWKFLPMDYSYLKNFTRGIFLNGGMLNVSMLMQIIFFFTSISVNDYGICHSGQLGDAVVGSLIHENREGQPYSIDDVAYSRFFKLSDRVDIPLSLEYDSQEDFLFFHRGLLACQQGNAMTQFFTEMASPFCDVDFLQFCMNIPLSFRSDHKLYVKWINKKHPNAARYVWETRKAKINTRRIHILGAYIPWTRVPRFLYVRALRGLGMHKQAKSLTYATDTPNALLPFDYWYSRNKDLRNICEAFFKKNHTKILECNAKIDIKTRGCIHKDMIEEYNGGNTVAKFAVLTLLYMIDRYF
jgi:asparagine synthase (glutamine-hydrolysing)